MQSGKSIRCKVFFAIDNFRNHLPLSASGQLVDFKVESRDSYPRVSGFHICINLDTDFFGFHRDFQYHYHYDVISPAGIGQ